MLVNRIRITKELQSKWGYNAQFYNFDFNHGKDDEFLVSGWNYIKNRWVFISSYKIVEPKDEENQNSKVVDIELVSEAPILTGYFFGI